MVDYSEQIRQNRILLEKDDLSSEVRRELKNEIDRMEGDMYKYALAEKAANGDRDAQDRLAEYISGR